jgi:hypothetical protein
LYTIETFLPYSVSKASRENDVSKIDNLGPYCYALGIIIDQASQNRKDIQKIGPKNKIL